MAGFFYLGGRDNNNKQDHHQDKSNYLYLYKDEICNTNKGFEIWPPQYFQQQQQQQQQHVTTPTNFYSFGMIPSGSSSSNNNNNRSRGLYFNVVSDHEPGGFTVTRQGGMNCQDCGNQAKKDCPHMRCRTCCKSRGFHCQTHVKSTWVPAAKRRERLAQLASLQHHSSPSRETQNSNAKRLREVDGNDNDDDKDHSGGGGSALATRVVNTNSNSGLEAIQNLPPEVSSPAVFRCVRVSSIEEDEDDQEYAYQTAVNIGGHIFKGILYDQGLDEDHHHQLNLLASTATTTNAEETAAKTAVTIAGNNNNGLILDPSSLYPAQLNSFIAGTPFFTPPRD
ncbi:Protein SHI RELATED SEQUENCE 5 [Raphanus sativus]|uniref:Protein SHI RELATED SEQUENCE 5 isoform X2 n=1 Tax=Raphanus sativus TaxID=3726 RepID=A0A6J0K8V2_RAPSA|nr:protein SHI RELATED SEQUENCE 5 isoform X2 [Raphanus sativus]KAJ4883844.1 Protein SHI RELATED SEQUENCE 5 [Raphanus sativus]